MLLGRLAGVCLALLVLVPASQAASRAQLKGPTSLHGFLLRADEPRTDSFSRTPAFAWNPVAGAVRYQFQLSTSSAFRENALIYTAGTLTAPVVAPTLTLPWITGKKGGHSLYARARAVTRKTTSLWSAAFGFDMEPVETPQPLPSFPGLLRWTPVEGADKYEIWFVDIAGPKFVTVYTNVLDEREFYTFHRTPSWTSTIRWRIRAVRIDRKDDNKQERKNTIPAAGYGPWSPVYSSTNPPYTAGKEIHLLGTVSDVVANGDSSASAHRLMPAFRFDGDQAADGTSAELFRVYVFTDAQCLNRVYTSSVTGGPAYAPRPFTGPLALPTSTDGIARTRGMYVPEGLEPSVKTFDGEIAESTESKKPASPTTAVPQDSDSEPSKSGSSAAPSGDTTDDPGAPVDLWDVDWPEGGYYWTVIPVETYEPPVSSTILVLPSVVGATIITVLNADGFAVGNVVTIGSEKAKISAIDGSTITLSTALTASHTFDETVANGGTVQYRDLELAQDVCAAGRIQRFGKTSEVSLTAGGELFASGLSPNGVLTSGRRTKSFYGSPIVSWTPALGASIYEAQWSKTGYPFKPAPNPQDGGALGKMVWGTSAVLPLTPGTWYYRVRGFDFSLPSGSQQMSWSDPARIVVSKPTFKIVGAKKKTTKK